MEPILISINEPQFKEPIIGKNREDLIEVTKNLGQPSFRSNQLYEWIYSKRTQQFDLMTNLGVKFIQELQEKYSLQSLKPVSYTHLRAHETVLDLVCRLLLEKKKSKHYEIILLHT